MRYGKTSKYDWEKEGKKKDANHLYFILLPLTAGDTISKHIGVFFKSFNAVFPRLGLCLLFPSLFFLL